MNKWAVRIFGLLLLLMFGLLFLHLERQLLKVQQLREPAPATTTETTTT